MGQVTKVWACLVTWFCYHLIAKPGNKTDAPDPYDPSLGSSALCVLHHVVAFSIFDHG